MWIQEWTSVRHRLLCFWVVTILLRESCSFKHLDESVSCLDTGYRNPWPSFVPHDVRRLVRTSGLLQDMLLRVIATKVTDSQHSSSVFAVFFLFFFFSFFSFFEHRLALLIVRWTGTRVGEVFIYSLQTWALALAPVCEIEVKYIFMEKARGVILEDYSGSDHHLSPPPTRSSQHPSLRSEWLCTFHPYLTERTHRRITLSSNSFKKTKYS